MAKIQITHVDAQQYPQLAKFVGSTIDSIEYNDLVNVAEKSNVHTEKVVNDEVVSTSENKVENTETTKKTLKK